MAEASQAPALSQTSSGAAPNPGQPQSTGKEGGDVFDFKRAFESQSKELGQTRERFGRLTQDVDGLKKEADTMRRIREALSPDSGKGAPDPTAGAIADAEKQLDYYLSEAVEAEKRGRPLPLTTNLAVQFFQSRIEHLKERADMQKELQALRQQTQQAADPQHAINVHAYSSMDSFVKQGLDSLYGRDARFGDQKRYQFDAITKQMGDELKLIMQHKPQAWEQMRRDPEVLKKFSYHFLKKNIPPAAVQIIEQENLSKTEMSSDELWSAFREAGQIQDPQERAQLREQIRIKILERMPWGEQPLKNRQR